MSLLVSSIPIRHSLQITLFTLSICRDLFYPCSPLHVQTPLYLSRPFFTANPFGIVLDRCASYSHFFFPQPFLALVLLRIGDLPVCWDSTTSWRLFGFRHCSQLERINEHCERALLVNAPIFVLALFNLLRIASYFIFQLSDVRTLPVSFVVDNSSRACQI